jgi:hypothetical protein
MYFDLCHHSISVSSFAYGVIGTRAGSFSNALELLPEVTIIQIGLWRIYARDKQTTCIPNEIYLAYLYWFINIFNQSHNPLHNCWLILTHPWIEPSGIFQFHQYSVIKLNPQSNLPVHLIKSMVWFTSFMSLNSVFILIWPVLVFLWSSFFCSEYLEHASR